MLRRKPSSRVRTRLSTLLGIVTVVATVLASSAWTTAAPPDAAPSAAPLTVSAWNTAMAQVATPDKGCYTAAYPNLSWQSVACATAPDRPYPPRTSGVSKAPLPAAGIGGGPATGPASGPGAAIVGNGVDYSAGVTGVMTGATGSFPTVSGVTSETGIGGANSYSLQLNTKPFTTTVCAGHPLCKGWEQFLYSSQGFVFIQFWLLQYNAACPAGWSTYTVGTDVYCWRNGSATPTSTQPITNLANLKLTGSVAGGVGGMDTASLTAGGPAITASTSDSVLNLSADWAAVEFAIVGDGGGSSANFNPGSTIVVQTVTHNGTTLAPTCLYEGYTGETNNLTLVGTPTLAMGASPAIQSTQSNVPGSVASCASAQGWGDTHITTFDGLMYDNQYRGAVTDVKSATMTVQANQVSGAPSWPNAAVNNAVATQMGADSVALCQAGNVLVDNLPTTVADGQTITLASGDKIQRIGNVYLVTDPGGDSMKATWFSNHIDLAVGLGHYPEAVSGLFANAPGNVNQLVTGGGTVLNAPLDFGTMYNTYVPSWAVSPKDSLLAACQTRLESPTPTAPFWAGNLPTDLAGQARAVCQNVGVRDQNLLDACTLDVAVLGDESAAQVYIGQKAPAAIGFK